MIGPYGLSNSSVELRAGILIGGGQQGQEYFVSNEPENGIALHIAPQVGGSTARVSCYGDRLSFRQAAVEFQGKHQIGKLALPVGFPGLIVDRVPERSDVYLPITRGQTGDIDDAAAGGGQQYRKQVARQCKVAEVIVDFWLRLLVPPFQ